MVKEYNAYMEVFKYITLYVPWLNLFSNVQAAISYLVLELTNILAMIVIVIALIFIIPASIRYW